MLLSKKALGRRCETIETLIGQNTEITGDISFTGGLRIDGKVKGNIAAGDQGNCTLVVSELGEVDGSVTVPYLIVSGTVKGDVTCSKKVKLQSSARVLADINYEALEMAAGAKVSGSMMCHADRPVATLKSVPSGDANANGGKVSAGHGSR